MRRSYPLLRRAGALPWLPATAAAAMIAFAGLSLHQYWLPGLYYDEAFDVVPAMQLLYGQPVQLARGVGVTLLGRQWPVMIGDYWGAVSTYAVLPLFALFGVGVFALRLWPIAAGVVAVWLTYLAGKRLFSAGIGAGASVLLAVFPSYVLWSRVGIYVVSHLVMVTLAIVLCYLRWRETRHVHWLAIAGLLTGIGLWTKLLFAWFLIAVPVAYAVVLLDDVLAVKDLRRRSFKSVAGERLREDLPRTPRGILFAAAGFLIGAIPVLYYNVLSRGSYLLLRANFFQTERGVNNLAFWRNVATEADALKVLLEGSYFWFYGGIFANRLYPLLAAVATLVLLALVHLAPGCAAYRRAAVFLSAFGAAIFVLSCFTISILGATHLLILLPVPQLFIAAAAVLGSGWAGQKLPASGKRRRWLAGGVFALVFGPLVAWDLWVDALYHRALAQTGGYSAFSSAIYTLAAELEQAGVRRPYALDWGFKYSVALLTGGRVEPQEIYGASHEPGVEFEAAVLSALADSNAVFISHTEEASAYPRLEAFRRIVASEGKKVVVERTLKQLDGKPVYYVIRAS